MTRYKTFIRSCRNWPEFARARKITQATGLTYAEAWQQCAEYRKKRTPRQIKRGTLMEFTVDD
jgi:hypothetical protein